MGQRIIDPKQYMTEESKHRIKELEDELALAKSRHSRLIIDAEREIAFLKEKLEPACRKLMGYLDITEHDLW